MPLGGKKMWKPNYLPHGVVELLRRTDPPEARVSTSKEVKGFVKIYSHWEPGGNGFQILPLSGFCVAK